MPRRTDLHPRPFNVLFLSFIAGSDSANISKSSLPNTPEKEPSSAGIDATVTDSPEEGLTTPPPHSGRPFE